MTDYQKNIFFERIAGTANSGYERRPVVTKDMLLDYETACTSGSRTGE